MSAEPTPRPPTAFELEQALADAIGDLESLPEGADVPEHLAALVAECLDAAEEKRDALAAAYRARHAHIMALEMRRRDIEAKITRAGQTLERFDAFLLLLLDARGEKRLRGMEFSIGWQQNPQRVEVDPDFCKTAVQYVRQIVREEPDKVAIKEALQRGEPVPGARLVEGTRRIVVK